MKVLLLIFGIAFFFKCGVHCNEDDDDYNAYHLHSPPQKILPPPPNPFKQFIPPLPIKKYLPQLPPLRKVLAPILPEPPAVTSVNLGSHGHGNECNAANPCVEHLICNEGYCACPENQVFSSVDGFQCVIMAGQLRPGSTSTPCINGSEPNSGGICTCQPHAQYFHGVDGRCYAKKSIDESCTDNRECNFDESYLVCDNGTCNCQPGFVFRQYQTTKVVEIVEREGKYNTLVKYNQTITTEYKKCVGLAGIDHECNLSAECVQFASCQNNSICICDAGTQQTSKGTCGVGYGSICSESVDCSDNFVCSDGKCECPQPNQEIYSSAAEKCLTTTLGLCSKNSDCVPNAFCSNVTNSLTIRRCECKLGFVPDEIGTCDLAFGSDCSYGSGIPCDSLAELKCRNKTCSCPDPVNTYFDPEARECLILAGSRCSRADNGTQAHCVSQATCASLTAFKHSKLHGICECSTSGFVQDENRHCAHKTE